MSLSASINPGSGNTPCGTTITASGGAEPYDCYAKPSPPNPEGLDVNIVQVSPGVFEVEIKSDHPNGTEIYFTVADANLRIVGVTFTSTG